MCTFNLIAITCRVYVYLVSKFAKFQLRKCQSRISFCAGRKERPKFSHRESQPKNSDGLK